MKKHSMTIALILGLCLALSLFAQDQPSRKLLAKTDQWSVILWQKTEGDSVKKVERRAILMASSEEYAFAIAELKISLRKRAGGSKGATYWETRTVLSLAYGPVGMAHHPNKPPELTALDFVVPDFVVFEGSDVLTNMKIWAGFYPYVELDRLKQIGETVLFYPEASRLQLDDLEKFAKNIQPTLGFAKKLLEAAESFDEKKGLPEEITKQIPTYLNLNPLDYGLVEGK